MGAAFLRPFRGLRGCTLGDFFSASHVCHGFSCRLVPVSGVVRGSSLSAFDYLDFSMDSTSVLQKKYIFSLSTQKSNHPKWHSNQKEFCVTAKYS